MINCHGTNAGNCKFYHRGSWVWCATCCMDIGVWWGGGDASAILLFTSFGLDITYIMARKPKLIDQLLRLCCARGKRGGSRGGI